MAEIEVKDDPQKQIERLQNELSIANDRLNKKYNGWTNYETWLVKLWIDNEYAWYQEWKDRASRRTKEESYELAKEIKDWLGELQDEAELTTGLFADLINAAICEVDFDEIAEALLEDYGREEEGDEDEEESDESSE